MRVHKLVSNYKGDSDPLSENETILPARALLFLP